MPGHIPKNISTLRTQRAENGRPYAAAFQFGFVWDCDRLHLAFEQKNGREVDFGKAKMPVTLKFKKFYNMMGSWNYDLNDPLDRGDVANLMFHYADGIGPDGKPEYYASEDEFKAERAEKEGRAYAEFARRHPEIPDGDAGREIWNGLRLLSMKSDKGPLAMECARLMEAEHGAPIMKLVNARNCEALSGILGISEKKAAELPKGLERDYLIGEYVAPRLPKRWDAIQHAWNWLKKKRAEHAETPLPEDFPWQFKEKPQAEQTAAWQGEQVRDGNATVLAAEIDRNDGDEWKQVEYAGARMAIMSVPVMDVLDGPVDNASDEKREKLRETIAALDEGTYAELMMRRLRAMNPEWADKAKASMSMEGPTTTMMM